MISQQITTAEDLDALPVGSVVLSAIEIAYQKRHDGRWRGSSDPLGSDLMVERGMVSQPLTVLYRPDVPMSESSGQARTPDDVIMPPSTRTTEAVDREALRAVVFDATMRALREGETADVVTDAVLAFFAARGDTTPSVTAEQVEAAVRDAIDRDYIEVFYDHDEVQGYSSVDDLIETVAAHVSTALTGEVEGRG